MTDQATDDARKIRLVMELRRLGFADTAVLSAIERVPRHVFVPQAFQDQAYENIALPIDAGQTISQPSVVAAMISALAVGPRMKVLEVGTGSGYQAAVLSHLCRRVYTVERHRTLGLAAEKRFRALRIPNIVPQVGDGTVGWPAQAPFHRIIVAAAGDDVPEALVAQLGDGGVLVAPVTGSGGGEIVRLTRTGDTVARETLMAARFVPLVSDERPAARSA